MEGRWSVRAITRTMFPLLVALTVIELGSGLVLDTMQDQLLASPSLLILVPVTIGVAGNLGSILAARLSTVFHLGLLSFDPGDDHLAGNAIATVALAVTLFPLVGVGAWALQWVVGEPNLGVGTIVLVALSSGTALAVLAVVVTLVTTYAAYRFGLDPDNVVIPVVTNVCDVLGVVLLFAAIWLFV